MKDYREDIKEDILMAAGATKERYYKKRSLNAYGYDPVDEIVITAAGKIRRAYKRLFGLLYDCHSIPASLKRLQERGHNTISEKTAWKYMRDSKAEIVNKVTNKNKLKDKDEEDEEDYLEKVKGALRAENDK